MTDRHVVVLAGGLTHERDVSLRSGARDRRRVATAADIEVTVRDADAELLAWLAEHRPDAAVIALHGGRGENGAVQGILQMSGIPYRRDHLALLPTGLGQADGQGPGEPGRVQHSEVDHAGPRHLPGSRRRSD